MSIRIDPEFKVLIPPLTKEELKQLEENILREGIRDPLVVWHVPNGDDILIDGHNRFEISAKHGGIPFETKRMTFDLREDAIRWIILNQFGRRNLSAYDRSILALKLKPVIAKQAKENERKGGGSGSSGRQKSDNPTTTSKELAKVAGVSHDTIHKVEVIEAKATPAQKEQVRSGEKSINRVFNEVMDKEIKRPPSAKEYTEQAKERHEEFREQTVVTISDIKQDKKDRETLEHNAIREIKKALGVLNDLYVMIDAGEIDVSALSEEGKTIALSTLNKMYERVNMIDAVMRKG